MPTRQNTAHKELWVLILTSIASLMVALDVLVVSTALSTIREHLHASIGELEWTLNAYSLSFAVLLISGAALGDRLGRRKTFAAGLGLFVAASAACALAPNIGLLIAARTIQGGAAAVIAPLALSLLSSAIPAERRGKALGIYSSITGLAVLGGPVLGGAVTQGLAWQWIFWLNVPIGLAAIPLVMRRLDESYGPRQRFDTRGLALITGAAFGIVWGLVRGNRIGWGSAETLIALIGGVVLTGAFVLAELRNDQPMLPMRLFKSRSFSGGSAAMFLLSCCLFGAVFFMAQFLQVTLHQGPLASGLKLLPWTATLFVVAPIAGALTDRIGERPLVFAGLTLQAAGMAWIALIARTGMPYGELIAPLIIAGAGISMAMPAAQNAVLAVKPADVGAASGAFTMMRQLGGVLGLAVVVAVFSGAGSYLSPATFADGFAPAIGVAAAFSLAGALSALVLPARRRPAPGAADAARVVETRGASTEEVAQPIAA
ncbi:MAG: DHA2 family efflux MFS transporter permease subunit [Solirubrobacteraceae bacterium]